MEYLVAAYGPDKLNDPSQAEPIVQQMIQMDPNEPANYFYLAKIYEEAGRYEDAEQTLLKAKGVKPNDPVVYTTLAGFYNRQGDFPKTMEACTKPPSSSRTIPRAITAWPSSTGRRRSAIIACPSLRRSSTSRRASTPRTRRSASTPTTPRR